MEKHQQDTTSEHDVSAVNCDENIRNVHIAYIHAFKDTDKYIKDEISGIDKNNNISKERKEEFIATLQKLRKELYLKAKSIVKNPEYS